MGNNKNSKLMEITNIDMSTKLLCLEPILKTATGKFGYAVARNFRKITEACTEFLQMRRRLIEDLGEKQVDKDGNLTGNVVIKVGTEKYNEYEKKIGEIAKIKHSVEIFMVSYDDLPNTVTAQDMIDLEWMLIDSEE